LTRKTPRQLLTSLRRPLAEAAGDCFRRVGELPELGQALRDGAGRLATATDGELAGPLARYVADLEEFEDRHEADKARLVALGLRLCAQLEGAMAAAGGRPTADRVGARMPGRRNERAVDEEVGPESPVTLLKGVGPALSGRLAARGLGRLGDLLYLLPLGYSDCRQEHPLEEVPLGEPVTVRGVVVQRRQVGSRRRRMLEVGLGAEVGAEPALWLVWFNSYPGHQERFPRGAPLLASGTARTYRDRAQMVHPEVILEPTPDDQGPVLRRYPEVEGVQPARLERFIAQACELCLEQIPDAVPRAVAEAEGLPSQAEALAALHMMEGAPDAATVASLERGDHPAHRRLVFDELFSMQLAVARRRQRWGERRGLACPAEDDDQGRLRGCFPFTLTHGQERVIGEILADMARPRPMHRLLQGDVGSGKTAVAFAAAWAAMARGYQAAIMAPTELLARQHHQVLAPWCEALGMEAALLTAATPAAARESLLALAGAGAIQLLIGTHSLLSHRVELPNLALAVVDEQHRFGVLQRARLGERGDRGVVPHMLVMTATPIPRSMALTLYGDLDLSVLSEKPAGRKPAVTRVYPAGKRDEAYAALERELERDQQAFVVCPLVEESDKVEWADAMSTAQRMTARFPEHSVGLVHGRLRPAERQQVMDRFRAGEVRLLVATTVIEVGIDVPRANVMLIEHAERFGLAQLHQLRGRVGRGEQQARCLLLTEAGPRSAAAKRLRVMAKSSDGFFIAQQDLELRGPGELSGTRQAGLHRLRFTDLGAHMELLSRARQAASRVVEADPDLEAPDNRRARAAMERRWKGLPVVDGGTG